MADEPISAVVAAYPMEEQYRAIDAAECATCGGDNSGDEPCPECGGDPDAPLIKALDALSGEVVVHAGRLGRRVKEIEAEAAVLQAHADAISARAAARRKRVAAIKGWLMLTMQSVGLDKVKDAFCTVYLQGNPPSFEITDEAAVPARYKRASILCPLADVPPELRDRVTGVVVSKAALKEALDADGEIPPGVEYVADRKHLRIR